MNGPTLWMVPWYSGHTLDTPRLRGWVEVELDRGADEAERAASLALAAKQAEHPRWCVSVGEPQRKEAA